MKEKNRSSITNNEVSPKKIVCVYAQNDESFYRDLQSYLSLWRRENYIQWLETLAGSDVKLTTQADLQQADLVLLLISPDFFAQSLCYSAMQISLQEQSKRWVPVVPVLARASSWKESACGELYPLPANERPISQWSHSEQAYEAIRAGLAPLLLGDKNFKQEQETTNSRINLIASQESAETRLQATPAYTLNFNNQGAKIGQQGTFSGNTTIDFD